MIFKLQHPGDLISRLFILEYMREIGADVLYAKANKHQKEQLFYKYTDEDSEVAVDVNWEYCLFVATLPQLEHFMKEFMYEIQEVEAKRSKVYKEAREQIIQERVAEPVDINVMDLAASEIKKNKEGGFKLD